MTEGSEKTVVVRHQLRYSADYADSVFEVRVRDPFSTLLDRWQKLRVDEAVEESDRLTVQ